MQGVFDDIWEDRIFETYQSQMLFRKKIRRISPKIGLISTGSRGGWNGELPKLSMESQLTAFIPRRPEAESILSHGVMVLIWYVTMAVWENRNKFVVELLFFHYLWHKLGRKTLDKMWIAVSLAQQIQYFAGKNSKHLHVSLPVRSRTWRTRTGTASSVTWLVTWFPERKTGFDIHKTFIKHHEIWHKTHHKNMFSSVQTFPNMHHPTGH